MSYRIQLTNWQVYFSKNNYFNKFFIEQITSFCFCICMLLFYVDWSHPLYYQEAFWKPELHVAWSVRGVRAENGQHPHPPPFRLVFSFKKCRNSVKGLTKNWRQYSAATHNCLDEISKKELMRVWSFNAPFQSELLPLQWQ